MDRTIKEIRMGTWGTGLYHDDTALDVKDQFEELINRGITSEKATAEIVEVNRELLTYKDDQIIFWLALADTQWERGVLIPYVKDKALAILDDGGDLYRWETEDYRFQLERRRVLKELKNKLLSEQPDPVKVKRRRSYKCPWKIGDVFAYRLESDAARDKGLYGRYLLIQKIDDYIWHPHHIVPIVYVKITKDSYLPKNIDEYNTLEYVQTGFSRYEERFWPIDGSRPLEDIAEKSLIKYEVDEYGLLPNFRFKLVAESKKDVPECLIYLDNYKYAVPPEKEFVPHDKINIHSVLWKNRDLTFESEIIKDYNLYNLRKSKIYNQ